MHRRPKFFFLATTDFIYSFTVLYLVNFVKDPHQNAVLLLYAFVQLKNPPRIGCQVPVYTTFLIAKTISSYTCHWNR